MEVELSLRIYYWLHCISLDFNTGGVNVVFKFMVVRLFFCSVYGLNFRQKRDNFQDTTTRDRFRVVILKLNSKEYIDGVLKSKVNFEFLVNLFVSENDRIH